MASRIPFPLLTKSFHHTPRPPEWSVSNPVDASNTILNAVPKENVWKKGDDSRFRWHVHLHTGATTEYRTTKNQGSSHLTHRPVVHKTENHPLSPRLPHLSCRRTASLACAISRKCDVPSEILFSRARRTSSCQDGEEIFSGVPARSAQISSIACSLSSTPICSNEMVKCMIILQLCSSDQRFDRTTVNYCALSSALQRFFRIYEIFIQ